MKTFYDVLGVSQNAPPEVIRAAYRAMSQIHHPNHHDGDKSNTEKMAQINFAYDALSDANTRASYDDDLKAQKARKVDHARREELKVPRDGSAHPSTPIREDIKKIPYIGTFGYVLITLFIVFTGFMLLYPKGAANIAVAGSTNDSTIPKATTITPENPRETVESVPSLPQRDPQPTIEAAPTSDGSSIEKAAADEAPIEPPVPVLSPDLSTAKSIRRTYAPDEITSMEQAKQYYGSDPIVRRRLGLPSRDTGELYP